MTPKLHLAIIAFFLSFQLSAQNYVSQSFDSTVFPPSGWTRNIISGTYTWSQVTVGISPTCIPHSGTGMAGYISSLAYPGVVTLISPAMNFSVYSSGSDQVSFWLFRDSSYTDSMVLYANTSSSLTGATQIGSIHRSYTYTPAEIASGWHQYTFTIPPSFRSSSTVYVIFKAVASDYSGNFYLDDISIDHLTPCTGTPAISVSGGTSVCVGVPFSLSATGSFSAGISYQWQQSINPAGPWANISGATNTVYNSFAGIIATTFYRCIDVCSNTGLSDTSFTLPVNINPPNKCYCVPMYTSTYAFAACHYANITNVSITGYSGSTLSDNDSACSSTGTFFVDRTDSIAAVNLQQNSSYTGIVRLAYNYYGNVGIWIDYNDDGIFSSSELVAGPVFYYGAYSQSMTLNIAASATAGVHRMRIRNAYNYTALTSIDPCNNYQYSSTHDYLVNIVSPVGTPTISTSGSIYKCVGNSLTLTASSSAPSPSYSWTGPYGFSATGSSIAFASLTPTNEGVYAVRVSSGGYTSAAAADTLYVNTPAIIDSVRSNSPLCERDTLKIKLSARGRFLAYLWNGPSYSDTFQNVFLPSVSVANTGTYSAYVTARGCSYASASASVIVKNGPLKPSASSNSPVCGLNPLLLNASDLSSGSLTYHWAMPDTSLHYNISNPTVYSALSGWYKVWVTNSNGCKSLTDSTLVEVDTSSPNPSVDISVFPAVYIAGFNVVFTANVTNGGTTPTFQWSKNGVAIPGATGYQYITSGVTKKDIISVVVHTSNSCVAIDSAVSNTWPLNVSNIQNNVSIQISPNPNQGTFVVKGGIGFSQQQQLKLEICNIIGQVIYSDVIDVKNGVFEKQVYLAQNIISGVYLLNIYDGDIKYVNRFELINN